MDKSLIEEVSEDEAIGEELDSFPPLTQHMMDEASLLNGEHPVLS